MINAINIYAGINGIEAGQTYVNACAIAVMNLLELAWRGPEGLLEGDGINLGLLGQSRHGQS